MLDYFVVNTLYLPRLIAVDIAIHLKTADRIYTPPATILYAWFLNPYLHSTLLLTKPNHISALQIDPNTEFSAIVAQEQRFSLSKKNNRHKAFL